MANIKISKAKINESDITAKCFRRCLSSLQESFSARLNEDKLLSNIQNGETVIIKEDKRVYGALRYTSLWGEAIFGKETTYQKESSILESFPYNEEGVTFIDYLFVDPSLRNKGHGTTLMKDLFRRHEEDSFLIVLFEDDEIKFFENLGFRPLNQFIINSKNPLNGGRIYVKPFIKEGICSNPAF